MNRIARTILYISIILFTFILTINTALADDKLILEYYYNENCGSCIEMIPLIDDIAEEYNNTLDVQKKEITQNLDYYDEYEYYLENYNVYGYPFIILKLDNNSVIKAINDADITYDFVKSSIDEYLKNRQVNESNGEEPFSYETLFGKINLNISEYSLPILTIILGGVDSFNPCAFFILIFLLNLLIYTRSRKRMILIGGIFIFFSGLLYFIFMTLMMEALVNVLIFTNKENIFYITITAGLLALFLGAINIKDFFFFKKGVSVGIPEKKKPGIYKQIRGLVKNPKVASSIIGTIILAGTVNFYELMCTFVVPYVYITRLLEYNLSPFENLIYIFFYNVVYVIPLIIIVSIFVFTLGRKKLTEWHGQILKFFSGIMLVSFGLLFLFNYQLLENPITPIILLIVSILSTLIISNIWKKYKKIEI